MTEKKVLTKEGYKKLLKELQELKDDKLPAVLQRLKEAIAQGDISENAEYETAIADKDMIEARIMQIESMILGVEIIEGGVGAGEVKYGSKVKLEDEKGQTYEYTVVGSGEVDILAGTVSFQSPLGMAIKGKKAGTTVVVKAPRGKNTIKIVSVK